MLSKLVKFEKINKIISTLILIGGCLIFGKSEEGIATGFRGVNYSSLGARPRTTNGNSVRAGINRALLGVSTGDLKKEKNSLINTIVVNLPFKTGDSDNLGLYSALLEHSPNSIKNKPSGVQERMYVNSENGNKVKIILDGSIISSIVEANGRKYCINFKEGWFQEAKLNQ